MSAAAHPVTSTSDPAPPAEGLQPVTPGASDAAAKQQKQQGKKEKKDKKGGGGAGGPLELNPPPEFFAERMKIFDEYKAKYDKWVSGGYM
jgi:threonyl-tRNA synthetase